MEVKIGIQSVPRELVVETDTPTEELERDLAAALAAAAGGAAGAAGAAGADGAGPAGSGAGAVFAVMVSKGGKVLVPADKIAYVEFVGPEARRIGFSNIT